MTDGVEISVLGFVSLQLDNMKDTPLGIGWSW